MSIEMNEEIRRWTARRKAALVMEIIQGTTTVAEASRQHDLTPSEVETWVDDAKRGMENALKARPEDIREQYDRQLKELQSAYGEAMLELRARKKIGIPAGQGRELILSLQQGLLAEGEQVSLSQLCRWFGVPRRTMYHRPRKEPPKVDAALVAPIKALIECPLPHY